MISRSVPAAAALLTCVTASAFAADLPMRTAPAPYVAPLPIFTWTGAYFGVNAGYAFDAKTRFDRTTGELANNRASLAQGLRPISNRVNDDGFTAGGQIGYNYQLQGFGFGGPGSGVEVGVEADAVYTDLDRTETLSNTQPFGAGVVPGALNTRNNQYRGSLDFLGTVRGRVGYAFNTFMVYGTGGFAYGDVNNRATFYGPNAPDTVFFSGRNSGLKTGYAYGGGIEYALPTGSFLNFFKSSAVTLKAEYLHYDLGSDNLTLGSGSLGLGSYTTRVRNEGDIARAGLNYKF